MLFSVRGTAQVQAVHNPDEIMVMLRPGYNSGHFLEEINSRGFLGSFRVKQVLSERYRPWTDLLRVCTPCL